MNPLKQPEEDRNCLAYVAAMATGTSVAEFIDFCKKYKPLPYENGPHKEIHIYAYALHCGYLVGYVFDEEFFNTRKSNQYKISVDADLRDSPAIVIVGADTSSYDHAIYWDGSMFYDPSPYVKNGMPISYYNIKTWAPIYKVI